jgi:hypothetical protein
MASWKGFEPLTPGLGNRCSILLSYQDVEVGIAWLNGLGNLALGRVVLLR